ncbi:MAG TPA: AmmeMemoRadiSam system protein A [Armatimonadota bacterium]|jgi:AmmeMemoRadiSam system protein A|nr:AmmeMemoRadiSam system protein A [Armatimonadota bacterium]HOJ21127.1 AmmeMemoRadiSam system protein A [Armatimonadota bacterium]HOM81005.1 AmmeMemoRadiSam system protein A [Armatimonadota bacterium]HOQ28125.1 AmmeMemoRadiSam system protein A [Armatimonadota bacterium]HPO72670.1 AmmeMemoRadiSam system protein A [Armatimonadota bacterium]
MADTQATGAHTPPVILARNAIIAYVTEGRVLDVPADLPLLLQQPSGCFVSLKKHGALRGCIGTITPVHPSLAEEIIHNGIAACRDPRFPHPVSRDELGDLVITVDVLEPPEPVAGLADFDPKRYGMILRAGSRRGLLLPDLEGVETPEEQYEIVCRKAGIFPGEAVEFSRFKSTRYH